MRNSGHSKLIYFLSTFVDEDRKLFREYLHSPLFNKKEEPRLLYEYILRYCLGTKIMEIDDTLAMDYLRPGQAADLPKLQKVKSSLMGLLLDFLAFRNWQRKPMHHQVALLEELNQMEDETYFEQYYRKSQQELAREKRHDMAVYADRFAIEEQYMIFRQKHDIRTADNNLPQTVAALEKLLVGHVLKYAYATANQRQIVGALDIPAWIPNSVAQVSVAGVVDEPLLELYHLLYRTLLPTTTAEELLRLQQLVLLHAPRCQPQEAYEIYTGALNNISRSARATGQGMMAENFALYQSMVQVYAVDMGRGLVSSHFKNIVLLGSRLGEFEWIAALLARGASLLLAEGDELQSALDYNHGVFHFYKGEFKAAEKYFNRVLADVKDIFYAADARMFLLMCFYETGDTLGMETLTHSFRMYLERSDRVSDQHRENYLAFIRIFKRLLGTPPNDQFRLQQLKAEIESLKLGAGKAWLLQAIG